MIGQGAELPYTTRTGGKLEFSALSQGNVWAALITFLYLDFLDATATAFALAQLEAKQVRVCVRAFVCACMCCPASGPEML
jgi:hypothetical protein